ncbi:MAG: hypothetical protein D6731_20070 [Planctomycetota bacterium]|nr:MAG: hypothetical protein D6731_20070 [Planctomycetota bacterium]
MAPLATRLLALTWGLVLLAAAPRPVVAQEGAPAASFKELVERGDYRALARKLRGVLDLERADPALRSALEGTLRTLARGAPRPRPGRGIVLVRGGKNDRAFRVPSSSGGDTLLIANAIRYGRGSWDQRLRAIPRSFERFTDAQGGDGARLHELERIIAHHKGGSLGTGANSTRSVLVSASTEPLRLFGPPYYILRVQPERVIFNYRGLPGEREVLLPFFVLPTEIVARVDSYEEARNHPLVRESVLRGVPFARWRAIEENIRRGRDPLEGIAGLDSFFPDGLEVGPLADEAQLERFSARVARYGGIVERVPAGDPRLPPGSQARTTLAGDRPKVLLPEGPVRAYALLDELTHVIQLRRIIDRQGANQARSLLADATVRGDPVARTLLDRMELQAKRNLRIAARPRGVDARALRRSEERLRERIRANEPFAELAAEVRREALRRAVTRIAARVAPRDAALAERLRSRPISAELALRHRRGPLEPALRELLRDELRRGDLRAEDLRVASPPRRPLERLALLPVDASLLPAGESAYDPPRRRGFPAEARAQDPRAPHTMHDLDDYLSDRLGRAPLELAARRGWPVELHVGGAREVLADLRNRGLEPVGEVRTPNGNYERLFVARTPEGRPLLAVAGAEGRDRLTHLASLVRRAGVRSRQVTVVGDLDALLARERALLAAGFGQLGEGGRMALIGFRGRMGKLLTERGVAQAGLEHLRTVLGGDPLAGLAEALRREAAEATGRRRLRLELLAEELAADRTLERGLRLEPSRVFADRLAYQALRRAERRLAEAAAAAPGSRTFEGLLAEGRLRLPGGRPLSSAALLRQVDHGALRFDSLRVRTAAGVEELKLVNNAYGDSMERVAEALLASGHTRLAYLGTAGGVEPGARRGDVHVPGRLDGLPDLPPGWNALEGLLRNEADLPERFRLGSTLGRVSTPLAETRDWLEAARARGVSAVEVEVEYLARAVAARARHGGRAKLYTALVVSDVVGGEHSLGNHNGAPKASFEAAVDRVLAALGIRGVELRPGAELDASAPGGSSTARAATVGLLPGEPQRHRLLHERLVEAARGLSGEDLERLRREGPGALGGSSGEAIARALERPTNDAETRAALERADLLLSQLSRELARRHGPLSFRVGGGVERGLFAPSEGLLLELPNEAARRTAATFLPLLRARLPDAPPLRLAPAPGGLTLSTADFRRHPQPLLFTADLAALTRRGRVPRGRRVEYHPLRRSVPRGGELPSPLRSGWRAEAGARGSPRSGPGFIGVLREGLLGRRARRAFDRERDRERPRARR